MRINIEVRGNFKLETGFSCDSSPHTIAARRNKNTQQASALPEKDSIQPQVPLRLPCYDFTLTKSIYGVNMDNMILDQSAIREKG